MAHRECQETFDRHLSLWEQHQCDMVVFTPEDATINTRGHFLWAYGPRGHHNAAANRRFKELLKMCARCDYTRFLICEYDALCLTPAIPIFYERTHTDGRWLNGKNWERPYLCGNVFHDDTPDKKFVGRTFVHPPLIITKAGLNLLLPHLNALPDDAEGGFWDRLLGLACERAGIEPMDFMEHGLGFARNTIEPDTVGDAHDAAANGAIFFHGVKGPSALEAIQAGHALAKANGKLRHGLEIAL